MGLMMFDLNSFYYSKQWRALLKQIRLERMAQNNLRCERCGKPLFRPGDCIGHHKIPLTPANVNDWNISMNPANIVLICLKCHNAEHKRFGSFEKEVFIVYGPPFSDAESFTEEHRQVGDLVISMDKIWEMLTGNPYDKHGQLKSIAFNIWDLLLEKVKYRAGKWVTAYIIGGFPFAGERERLAEELGATLLFMDTPRETCIERLHRAAEKNSYINVQEYLRYIDEWFERFTPDE